MGWSRQGRKGAFRYYDSRDKRISDEGKLARIEALAIPPAWKDVWISPRATAKLQATGFDAAGRKQYLYSADYRAQQERAKYDKLIRFGDALPTLREAMSLHFDEEEFARERVSAIALRLIELGWFRVGSERYVRDGTFGVTTLLRRHVAVRGRRVRLSFPAKHGIRIRSEVVDPDLSAAMGRLQVRVGGARLQPHESTSERLREDLSRGRVQRQGLSDMGRDVARGDLFRATCRSAGISESEREQHRSVTAVMRRVAK